MPQSDRSSARLDDPDPTQSGSPVLRLARREAVARARHYCLRLAAIQRRLNDRLSAPELRRRCAMPAASRRAPTGRRRMGQEIEHTSIRRANPAKVCGPRDPERWPWTLTRQSSSVSVNLKLSGSFPSANALRPWLKRWIVACWRGDESGRASRPLTLGAIALTSTATANGFMDS